jgi:hypothetical protein
MSAGLRDGRRGCRGLAPGPQVQLGGNAPRHVGCGTKPATEQTGLLVSHATANQGTKLQRPSTAVGLASSINLYAGEPAASNDLLW